jgi:threonine synthase
MKLYSTKHQVPDATLQEAVFKGLPADNGLFMPYEIPVLPSSFFETIETKSFPEIAFQVAKALIGDDIPDKDLRSIIDKVLDFEAPLVEIESNTFCLELFHGPSMAFKDFGARFMAGLMSYFLQKENKEINILVATSGDTGGAVAQGFLDMPGIKVTILYPSGKVSELQEKQLTTLGRNITALEVDGVFDDCQRLVKEAFLDQELNARFQLSSANSINISRLIPQSFYYFYAYARVKKSGLPVVFTVPSGNFGNLCGGLIAWRMGLPIDHFVAGTNLNDSVPQYLASGVFASKASVATISNAMDVGNPSNFPRVLELFGGDYDKLKQKISGYAFDDDATRKAMQEVHAEAGYVMCPHTAVAYLAQKAYAAERGTAFSSVFLGTAHPAKFLEVVEPVLGIKQEVPPRLQVAMEKPKQAIPMSTRFEDFKAFLLA